jgi:hypothetical protein
VTLTGRAVALDQQPWLAGPVGGAGAIGFDFVERHARAERLVAHERDEWGRPAGLLPRFVDLAGPRFDPGAVHPAVAAFYERTSAFRLELWSRWTPAFLPLGRLLARLFTGRLAQLEMPLDPLETAAGVESRVIRLVDPASGALRSVFWARAALGQRPGPVSWAPTIPAWCRATTGRACAPSSPCRAAAPPWCCARATWPGAASWLDSAGARFGRSRFLLRPPRPPRAQLRPPRAQLPRAHPRPSAGRRPW